MRGDSERDMDEAGHDTEMGLRLADELQPAQLTSRGIPCRVALISRPRKIFFCGRLKFAVFLS